MINHIEIFDIEICGNQSCFLGLSREEGIADHHCTLCNVTWPNEEGCRSHMNGSKHVKAVLVGRRIIPGQVTIDIKQLCLNSGFSYFPLRLRFHVSLPLLYRNLTRVINYRCDPVDYNCYRERTVCGMSDNNADFLCVLGTEPWLIYSHVT